jgi:hypothetical protein
LTKRSKGQMTFEWSLWYNIENVSSRVSFFFWKLPYKSLYIRIMNPQNCRVHVILWFWEFSKLEIGNFENFNHFDVVITINHRIYYRGGKWWLLSNLDHVVFYECELFVLCPCTILVPIFNNHFLSWFGLLISSWVQHIEFISFILISSWNPIHPFCPMNGPREHAQNFRDILGEKCITI